VLAPYASSETTAAPMIPNSGSSSANPPTVTASARNSGTPASSGRPSARNDAPSTRFVLSTTAATINTRATFAASTYGSLKKKRINCGATISSGTDTAIDPASASRTKLRTLSRRALSSAVRATTGNAAVATDWPMRFVSDVIVTAVTYSPSWIGARKIEMTS
jgi:hypothetical protein